MGIAPLPTHIPHTPLSKCIKEALEKIAYKKTLIEEEFVFTGIDQ